MTQVEICCGSLEDGLAAYQGGAKRIELNSALYLGGLSPSLASLKLLKEKTDLEIICMVRPRGAGFHYSDTETEEMMEQARIFLENGADGIAFGFLKEDGTIDEEKTKGMIDLIHSYGKSAVFHRAFDVTPNPDQAIQTLISLGIDRVLTSGQKATAIEGEEEIAKLQKLYGDQIEILAGSGINENNAKSLIEKTGICQVHSSAKGLFEDPTTKSAGVSYSYQSAPHELCFEKTDADKVHRLIESLG